MSKKKIGITGQNGFVGKHLFNTIGLDTESFERIVFDRKFFNNEVDLDAFVSQCDVIVHLAGMNRHEDPQVIYNVNVELTRSLVASLERTASKAHVIFASSTQEEKDNLYGLSKKDARNLIATWSEKQNTVFTGMIIPNVFGPFGAPYYNSVVSTFCHQLTHNETPVVHADGSLKLIYVGELVTEIIDAIKKSKNVALYEVKNTSEKKVSEILGLLEKYKAEYLDKGNIPALESRFEIQLFNTLRSFEDIKSKYPVAFKQFADVRGSFSEIIRLNVGGQVSFSTTVPGATRGNHFHTRKIERFAVIKGKALIRLRRIGTDEVIDLHLNGDEPSFVDTPIWYAHNISNIGEEDLYTIFWINEFYNNEDPDTFFEAV